MVEQRWTLLLHLAAFVLAASAGLALTHHSAHLDRPVEGLSVTTSPQGRASGLALAGVVPVAPISHQVWPLAVLAQLGCPAFLFLSGDKKWAHTH
jgi:hypothetical protein